jgi:C-terminal processing protease CtpA/Prc
MQQSLVKSVISSIAAMTCSIVTTTASARTELDIRPMSEARAVLKPQTYTAEQRQLVASQSLMFIKNLYVHRELKIKDFGAGADPVPRLEDMVRRAAAMNDAEFHIAMQKIFIDLHDHHTNYMAPMPLRCSYAIAPLDFADVYDGGSLKVIVRSQTSVLEKFAPEAAKAQIGDELVAVNDKPIKDLLEDLKKWSGGANEDAMITGAIMNLAFMPLAELPVPAKDTIKYTLKRGSETITIASKYFAALNLPGCVQEMDGEDAHKTLTSNALLRAENPHIRVYKDLVAPNVAPFAETEAESLPVGKFYTFSTPAGNLAKFDLETFVPEGHASSDDVIHQVRTLLENAQPTTDALIIDMRGNGGGLILLAEGLTQLFTPNQIQTMPVRYLPNDLNLSMFLNSNQGHENGWSHDTRDGIKKNARYTAPRVITSRDAANRYGQVWFKPVVILTDANCYSACDLFAASMQDHAAATIIGTHATTGAGGANVMDYDIFRQIFEMASPENNPFANLPGKQGMRVSWRQTIRVGKNKGLLIEDAGVKSDIVVRYVSEDIVGGESHALMSQVHKAISKIIPRYKSSIALSSSLMMKNGAPAKWSEIVSGVDSVEVVDAAGKVIAQYDVTGDQQPLSIDLADIKGKWSEKPLHVVGKLKNVTQFSVVREVRWRGAPVPATKLAAETFTGETLKFFHMDQSSGQDGEGWQVREKSLVVGKGDHYSPNVTTQVFATLDTAGKSTVTLDLAMTMETEEDMDFVNIILRDPNNGHEQYLLSASGSQSIKPIGKVQIPVNDAQQLEVVFEFMSDENWHLKGPKITKLAVQAL